jgi:catechol 2,3-dioxygenase-like lactoylglutathione lyase family enzyme
MHTIANFKIRQISPQLLVADLERSIAFYTQKLGFMVDFRYEDFYSGISKGGRSIHLKSGDPSTRKRESGRKNEDLDLVFSVDNIEIVYEELSKVIEITQPLRSMPYGKEFYAADPDGHIIGFVEAT